MIDVMAMLMDNRYRIDDGMHVINVMAMVVEVMDIVIRSMFSCM